MPRQPAICSLTWAMRCASELIEATELLAGRRSTPACSVVELLAGVAKARGELVGAAEHDLARGQVLRLARHVDEGVEELAGGIAEAGLAGAGTPVSSCSSCAARVASPTAIEREVVASRVRKSSCARVTVATLTPLPKKPAPAELAAGRRELDLLARIARRVGVGDVVAGRSAAPRSWRTSRACRGTSGPRRSWCSCRRRAPSGQRRAAGAASC